LILKSVRVLLLSLDSLTSLAFNCMVGCTNETMNQLCSIINSSPLNQLKSLELSNYDGSHSAMGMRLGILSTDRLSIYLDASFLENILSNSQNLSLYIHDVRMKTHSIKLLLQDSNKFKSLMLSSILVGNKKKKPKMKRIIRKRLGSILDAYIKSNPHAIIKRSLHEYEQCPLLTLISDI